MTKISNLPEALTITNTSTLIILDQGTTKKISYQVFRATALKGDTGTQGSVGPTGPKGNTGSVATIGVGTVSVNTTSTAPTVRAVTTTTTGSAVVTLLDFVFPLGPKGDTGTFIATIASTTTAGVVKIGNGISVDSSGTISASSAYQLEPATEFSLGGVIVGDGLSVDNEGVISTVPSALTTATSTQLGAVKIGAGVNIVNGVISVTTGAFALQTATSVILGGVKIGTGISITPTGIISVNTATTTALGGVKIGTGLVVSNSGTVSVNTGLSLASSLTGSTLANNVTLSSLTTLGTLTNLVVQGTTTLQQTLEVFTQITNATGVVVHDCSTGVIFVHGVPTANWTANFINVSTATNRVMSVAVLINQNSIPYVPVFVQINGQPQTVNWQGNITPTGNANKKDLVNFTFVSPVGTATNYTVLGSLASYG